jgi:hypothetical protein
MSCLDAVIECLDMNSASDGGTILAAVPVSKMFRSVAEHVVDLRQPLFQQQCGSLADDMILS